MHPHQPTEGLGRHGHNGEIYTWLSAAAPNSRRILSAALAVLGRSPVNLQETIARAYNSPVSSTVLQSRLAEPWHRAVAQLIDYRSSVWIKHGIELPELISQQPLYQLGVPYPPMITRQFTGQMVCMDPDMGFYAVELDSMPFANCADHDAGFGSPWAYVAGYIPVQVFHQLGGSLHRPPDRDHLYALSDIPGDSWVFVHRPFGPVVENSSAQKSALNQLLNSGLCVIPQETVDLTHQLLHLLRNHEQTGNLVNK